MDIFLQAWGGICYLLNKVFLWQAESKTTLSERKWRVSGWIIYLAGLPAWVIILMLKHKWIAAATETGGALPMILGLVVALKEMQNAPRWLTIITQLTVYAVIASGFAYSIHEFGGITTFPQILELGVTVGFLMGSYLLAKKNSTGWLYFMLMNASMGILMAMQAKPILAVQQLISIIFVIAGYRRSQRK